MGSTPGSNVTEIGGSNKGPFPETRWTLVSLAGKSQTVRSLKALDELLAQYCPALKTHLTRHLRLPPDRADDLLQNGSRRTTGAEIEVRETDIPPVRITLPD